MTLPDENRTALIADLAYQMYEQDGRPAGKAEEHWARAERALGMMNDQSQALGPEIPLEVSP